MDTHSLGKWARVGAATAIVAAGLSASVNTASAAPAQVMGGQQLAGTLPVDHVRWGGHGGGWGGHGGGYRYGGGWGGGYRYGGGWNRGWGGGGAFVAGTALGLIGAAAIGGYPYGYGYGDDWGGGYGYPVAYVPAYGYGGYGYGYGYPYYGAAYYRPRYVYRRFYGPRRVFYGGYRHYGWRGGVVRAGFYGHRGYGGYHRGFRHAGWRY